MHVRPVRDLFMRPFQGETDEGEVAGSGILFGEIMNKSEEHPPTQAHNYLAKIQRLLVEKKLPPYTVTDAFVAHDEWCDFNRGGFCNCDPDVEI